MRCRACGTRLADGAEYCHRCGSRVTEAYREENVRVPEVRTRRGVPDEEEVVLWEGTYSWKAMIWELVFAVVGTFAILAMRRQQIEPQLDQLVREFAIPLIALIWLFYWVSLMYRKLRVGYRLTSQRLIHRHGILHRRTRRIEAIDIDDLSYEQGIVEQLFNVGRIYIDSSDVTDRGLMLEGIHDPQSVYELIEKARRNERLRYGLHIESV
ncbi:MAG: PH domain-containing protein [Planctomycetota bacterium]